MSTNIAHGRGRAIPHLTVLVCVLAAMPLVPTEAREIADGRGLAASFGASGGVVYGDPVGGGYFAVRLPSEGRWAIGVDGNADLSPHDQYYGIFAAFDRELSDMVSTQPGIVLSAGGRVGVVVEHDDPSGRNRMEPYPGVGVYGTGAWYFAPRAAMEARISVDVGSAPRFGGALGMRLGR